MNPLEVRKTSCWSSNRDTSETEAQRSAPPSPRPATRPHAQAVGHTVIACSILQRRRHNYRRKAGHRQQLTLLRILSVGEGKAPAPKKAAETKAAAPAKKEAAPAKEAAPEKEAIRKAPAKKAAAPKKDAAPKKEAAEKKPAAKKASAKKPAAKKPAAKK